MRKYRNALHLALAVAAAVVGCGPKPTIVPRPNVVVIVMDTTRGDRCSFNGYERPTTPRLAEFAKDAVVFRDAWSPAGWTGPAHASLFTGLRPENHGFHEANRFFLDERLPTLAERLAAVGYATGCFTNNDWIAPEFGLSRGFQTVEAMYKTARRPYPWAAATHAAAAEWAETQAAAGRPFFLFVNDMEPHLPYTPPPPLVGRFIRAAATQTELDEALRYDFPRTTAYALGVEELSPRSLALLSDLYDAEIAALDWEIGVLLSRLDVAGLLSNTLVVITADHGEMLGERHMTEHSFTLSRAVRHVPLIARLPGVLDRGRVVPDVVRLEDVAPTILELCRVEPGKVDGLSLLRDLPGRISHAFLGENQPRRSWFQTVCPGADPTRLLAGIEASYDGRMHRLTYTDGRREVYDVAVDPGETNNLAGRFPE